MYYCNNLYSLSVLSLYEGELIGKVDKLFFDNKLKKLIELELVGEDGAKLVLPTKNIFHVGKNAITVKNNQAVTMREEYNYCPVPLNTKAYSINGEFFGVVDEITLDEKFLTQKISINSGIAKESGDIASFGKTTIVFYNGTDRPNLKRFNPTKQPKVFKNKETQTVEVLPVKETKNVIEVQKAQAQNSEFLIGRICTKDIFNFNNELLIKAHSVVNKKTLKEINKFGKLRELMLYCVDKKI